MLLSAWLFLTACSHYPLLAGLEAELAAKHSHVPASLIRRHLVTALLQIARDEFDIKRSDLLCLRDYSRCPTDWAELGDGSCAVPLAYQGPCTVVSFDGKTPMEKSTIAQQCDASFPCLDRLLPDYSGVCPEGWTESGLGKCSAPATYAGPCVLHYDFSTLDENGKRKFEDICEVFWPARTSHLSFLQFPNIATRLRNGVFATGPMRSPPRALINVEESENMHAFLQRGSVIAKENNIRDLQQRYAERIDELEGTAS